jgi:hypothetical protein
MIKFSNGQRGIHEKNLMCGYRTRLNLPSAAIAHHGAVSLALGPGSPIETASLLSLPEGGFVVSPKLEYVPFREFHFAELTNKDSFTFYNLSLFYGITPYLTAGVVFPYSVKKQDTLGTNSGLGDIGLNALLGFNYHPAKGFWLNKAEDSAVSLDEVRIIFLLCTFLPEILNSHAYLWVRTCRRSSYLSFRGLLAETLIVHFCSVIQDFKHKSIIFISTHTSISL